MDLKFYKYISNWMKKAEYKYDKSVNSWIGYINGFPGIYAQADTIEDVRNDLVSSLEDYILIDIKKNYSKRKVPGFAFSSQVYA